ncbi:MAG: cytochrome C552 [Alphaproteobacteria bacterium]|nr:cytochrome C552 [Alphaproteobacteria bacterium]
MSQPSTSGLAALWGVLTRPSSRYSLLAILAVGFFGGIVFWGGFNTAMEATNTMGFCTSCHEMRDNVYAEYRDTIHFQNRTGVRATCSDCHVPNPWVHKVARKIQATNELFHWALGTVDTPEKFEARRLELAKRVWTSMKQTDSRECRNCHTLQSMSPELQRPRARKPHLDAMQAGNTCIDCHKGIAHKNVRDRLAEAELERLERPIPADARPVPREFLDSLDRIAAKEKAAKAQAAMPASPPAAAPVASAASAPAATAAAASTAPASAGAWGDVEAVTVPLFYPGQASYEWLLTGKDHGGARAFLRAGDRCSTCHAKEAKEMGAKIVSGQKVEATPIPGKRPFIDLKVQAMHDGQTLSLRFQWPDTPHAPAPFVPGGKMDAKNATKLAIMIAGTGIERVDQSSCWATCHHDSRSMPSAPAGKVVTKYIPESRTAIEIQGSDGPRGGWDKLKPAADLEALLKGGTFMDLMRWSADGTVENGHVMAERVMTGGVKIEGQGGLENGVWTVMLRRPLRSDQPGDVSLEPGKEYTLGFAVHDDFSAARFHHVSVDYRFGLDTPGADINARKR